MTSSLAKALSAATLLLVIQFAVNAAEDEQKNRLIFEPGTTEPQGHESEAQEATAATTAEEGSENVMPPPKHPENMPTSVAKVLDVFFGQLTKGNIDGAYSALTNGTVVANNPTDIDNLKDKTEQAFKIFGAIRGYEALRVREVGDHLLGITCISLGELYPLRWIFIYYMPKDSWTLIDIRVDDGLTDLFPDGKSSATDNQFDGS